MDYLNAPGTRQIFRADFSLSGVIIRRPLCSACETKVYCRGGFRGGDRVWGSKAGGRPGGRPGNLVLQLFINFDIKDI